MQSDPETFIIQWENNVPNPTNAESSGGAGSGADSGNLPGDSGSVCHDGGAQSSNAGTPSNQNSTQSTPFSTGNASTPSASSSEETPDAPLKFRGLEDIFASTEEV
jgi:hypothetical protein